MGGQLTPRSGLDQPAHQLRYQPPRTSQVLLGLHTIQQLIQHFLRNLFHDASFHETDLPPLGNASYTEHATLPTGRLQATPEFLALADLRLGGTARKHLPEAHAWFTQATGRLDTTAADTALQWNALCKIAALSGRRPGDIDTDAFATARAAIAEAYKRRGKPEAGRNVRAVLHRLQLTLFHDHKIDSLARPVSKPSVTVTGWDPIPALYRDNAHRYIEQVRLSLRPSTVKHIEHSLRVFGTWLADHHPDIDSCARLDRRHIEEFKIWISTTPSTRTGKPLARTSIKEQLINLGCFFERTTNWGYPNAPCRPLLFAADLPRIDRPLPRFLDDAAAKLARATRTEPDPLTRLCVEILARTGIRLSELTGLTIDAVVQIGSAFWLRIPVGKLHNDRYIPLHPDLKTLLDDWITNHRPTGLRSDRLLLHNGRPITKLRVSKALGRIADNAGIGHVTPHQLRHTLATQAINRGMSLEAIAALLGHKTLAMTMVYARIADKTVAEEYFAVTEKVEALYDQPHHLPATNEGTEMRKLRAEMHRRMLGNGYCARPVEMDCHFESICETCDFFVTTIEFKPTLQRQRDDAANKGQIGRQNIFDGLLNRLNGQAS
ncbi:MAG TPA: integrase [Acidimicrobiales bacterium]|nr:integrase [Acidimicrobiales bacterium]